MSLINPIPQQSVINLYRGVAWDNSYQDVRLFNNQDERSAYLAPKIARYWNGCSVVKPGKTIKLEGSAEEFLTCNYLSWKNIGLPGAREYYAFIRSINYINVNSFEVEYEIDWIQSYLFNFVFESFHIEREHVAEDVYGANTVPENIDFGEYCIEDVQQETYATGLKASYLSQVQENVHLNIHSGVYSGVNFAAQRTGGALPAVEIILSQLNKSGESNEVVQLVMIVANMIDDNGMHESFNVDKGNLTFKFGQESYTAENKKMQIFPYKHFTIDNFEGGIEQYRYEEFADTVCSFAVEGTMHPKPCMQCFPINYKGWLGTNETPNTCQQFAVQFDNFPDVAWTSDSFRAWVSQNSVTHAKSFFTSAISLPLGGLQAASGILGAKKKVLSAVSGGASGAGEIANGLFSAAETIQDIENHKIHGQSLEGSIGSAGMCYMRNTVGFRATQYCIRPEMARRIDHFFSRYGYRVDTVKVPNVRGRRFCNFVKGNNAQVSGDIAEPAKLAMESALESGVTFWHTDDIGMEVTTNLPT